jgi:hypothetical protein
MDRIDPLHGPRAASLRLGQHAMLWLMLALPSLGRAQSMNLLERLQLPDTSTLLVLGAGFGVVLIAAGVLIFAIRQLRREAEERRRLYNRHRRGGHVHRSHLGPPRAPMAD